MTVQFRSRIKSIFDHGQELKKTGKCCFSDGTSSQNLTFLECFNLNGQFFQDIDAPCPSTSAKGHCCACSFLSADERQAFIRNLPFSSSNPGGFFLQTDIGIRSDVTECECNRIGGNWAPLSTTLSSNICRRTVVIDGSPQIIDVRIPSACCSLVVQDNQPVGVTCNPVCSAKECANLSIVETSNGSDVFFDSTFVANKSCTKSIVAGVLPVSCQQSNFMTRMATASSAFGSDVFGPCYELLENSGTYSYSCNLTPSFSCNGYWIDPSIDSAEIVYCDHRFAPDAPVKTNSYVNPSQYTQQEFDALGLEVGDEFQGGIYIGTFKPLKPNATNPTKVYGSLNFSTPQSIYPSVTDESPHSKWAIVVNKSFLETSLVTDNDINIKTNTSYYDGYLNAYGSLVSQKRMSSVTLNTIAGSPRNGFIDYYVPSIIELMFFAEQFRLNSILDDIFTINGIYCSTSFFTDQYITQNPSGNNSFYDTNLMYGLNLTNGENFGKSVLLGINTTVKLMLFRKIVIS